MHCSVYAVKKDDRLRHIGEEDRFDDETVFIIKRSWPKASHNRVADPDAARGCANHPEGLRSSHSAIATRLHGAHREAVNWNKCSNWDRRGHITY